ncbi:helix-turn-helix domain-containing protein [Agrobacterium genomosp. 3 str. RTP8]|uniref:helix-turn-helix domain-containing protein n=1 Tax=Agrobacterium tomkonis TaxID=1183410 RepID=UPI001CDA4945|nr:helix-turn-helix domain-containing protein [Agrobacterium tomkonis RTP8]
MELENLSTPQLAELIARAGAILAKRAGEQRPAQFALLPDLDPIDPTMVDLEERLSDGSRRWLTPKEAAPMLRLHETRVIDRINAGLGVKIGGRYYFDMLKYRGR